jgi:phosphate uptake regulator
METRKVQMTGGSSYIITLPKDWVKAFGVKKNTPLGITTQPDGTLVITPRITHEQQASTKEILVGETDDPRYIFRLLVGTYISGYTNIIIKSVKNIRPEIHDSVTRFTQIVIGPEIIEEAARSITIKDLLNPTEMPFEKTIKRMYLLVNSMHQTALLALTSKDKELAGDVERRDRDVDRLQWLVARQANISLTDFTLLKKMGVSQSSVTVYYTTSRILERIGDHAVIIAENVPAMLGARTEKVMGQIRVASDTALKMLSKSMTAWQHKDMKLANENIESVDELVRLCERIGQNSGLKGEAAKSITYISESLRRTGEYAADISELVMNQLLTEA